MKAIALGIFISGMFIFPNSIFAISKIIISPDPVTIAESGGAQTFTIQLSEPIIAPIGSGYVTIELTSTDSRLTLSTSSITYADIDWLQTKSFNLTAIPDTIHNATSVAPVTFIALSNSAFYSNYVGTTTITITDDTAAPVSVEQSRHSNSGATKTRYGCADKSAKNYKKSVKHRPELCRFEIKVDLTIAPQHTEVKSSSTPSSFHSSYLFTRDLSVGLSGSDVKALQEILIRRLAGPAAQTLKNIGATGYYGTLTKNAVIEFQINKGITPSVGVFGPKTRFAIGR